MAFYEFFGPAINSPSYSGSEIAGDVKLTHGRNRSLSSSEEFVLVLVRLHVGLFEKDLADRFGISVSTVSGLIMHYVDQVYLFKIKRAPNLACS